MLAYTDMVRKYQKVVYGCCSLCNIIFLQSQSNSATSTLTVLCTPVHTQKTNTLQQSINPLTSPNTSCCCGCLLLPSLQSLQLLSCDVPLRPLRPRYGPLWFGLLRMVERNDVRKERRSWCQGRRPCLEYLRAAAHRAIGSISKELVWKVHFELAQAEERAADIASVGLSNNSPLDLTQSRNVFLENARVALLRSLLAAPPNLKWKVLLAGSRLELSAGSITRARRLLCKAFAEVPPKSRSHIYLECSRVEEYAGNTEAARRLLARACKEVGGFVLIV